MTMRKPDGLLEYDVREMLSSDRLLDDGRVQVTVRDGLVSRSGAVGSFEESARAAQDAGSVRGVTGVDNRLVTLLGTAHHHFQAAAAKRAVATVDGVRGSSTTSSSSVTPSPGTLPPASRGPYGTNGSASVRT